MSLRKLASQQSLTTWSPLELDNYCSSLISEDIVHDKSHHFVSLVRIVQFFVHFISQIRYALVFEVFDADDVIPLLDSSKSNGRLIFHLGDFHEVVLGI